MSTVMQDWPRRHRISVDGYHRMAEAGLFAKDERVELIDGEIIDMPPMGSAHAAALTTFNRLLTAAVGQNAIVRPQLPVRLSDYSEPQPDIAVVKARSDIYRRSHPAAADVLLLVEISDATLHYDREVKVAAYGRSGIREVWIVDLKNAQIHFYRNPNRGEYSDASSTADYRTVEVPGLTGVSVDLAELRA